MKSASRKTRWARVSYGRSPHRSATELHIITHRQRNTC